MTIGEQTDNRVGLTGIAYRSKLMPVRVLDAYGDGDTNDIVSGVRWATSHGARVIVMSLNFACGVDVPPLDDALRQAWRRAWWWSARPATSGPRAALPAGHRTRGHRGRWFDRIRLPGQLLLRKHPDRRCRSRRKGPCKLPWNSRNRPILRLGMVTP